LIEADQDVTYLVKAVPRVADLAALRDRLVELTGDDIELEAARI
jgi:hypothetical protein